MPLIGAGVGGLAAGLSAFGRKNPKFNYQQSAMERQGLEFMNKGMAGYEKALNNEFAEGSAAQKDLATLLKEYAAGGNLPGSQDWTAARGFAQQAFDPQRVALQQAFEDQLKAANRQASLSGRGVNDPVLRAKLAQEQMRQSQMLEAQQGAAASNMALQLPGQRLGFMGERANTLVARGQNALSAQQGMFGMGNTAVQGERAFGMQMAQGKFMEQQAHTSFAQRLGATLQGAMAGAGAGMSMQGMQSQNNLMNAQAAQMSSGGAMAGGGNTYQGFGLGPNGNYGFGSPAPSPFSLGANTASRSVAAASGPRLTQAPSSVNYGEQFGPSAGLSMQQFNSDASIYQQRGQLMRFQHDPYTAQYANPQQYGPW